jgi:hypothetical protein
VIDDVATTSVYDYTCSKEGESSKGSRVEREIIDGCPKIEHPFADAGS